MSKTPEGAVLKLVLDYLAAEHIFAMRQNTGAVSAEHNGKKRFMRFGTPGCADVLAFTHVTVRVLCSPLEDRWHDANFIRPLWIECKAAKGKQSELQLSFQKRVEAEGHKYVIVRELEDLKAAL